MMNWVLLLDWSQAGRVLPVTVFGSPMAQNHRHASDCIEITLYVTREAIWG